MAKYKGSHSCQAIEFAKASEDQVGPAAQRLPWPPADNGLATCGRRFIDSQHQQNGIVPGLQTPFFAFFADPLRSLRLKAFYRKGRKESRKEREENALC